MRNQGPVASEVWSGRLSVVLEHFTVLTTVAETESTLVDTESLQFLEEFLVRR